MKGAVARADRHRADSPEIPASAFCRLLRFLSKSWSEGFSLQIERQSGSLVLDQSSRCQMGRYMPNRIPGEASARFWSAMYLGTAAMGMVLYSCMTMYCTWNHEVSHGDLDHTTG